MWKDFQLEVDKAEVENVSNNGSGKEWANYLVVYNNGKVFDWNSDAMQPEDATFTRDLSWIVDLVLRAYQQGRNDMKPKIADQSVGVSFALTNE